MFAGVLDDVITTNVEFEVCPPPWLVPMTNVFGLMARVTPEAGGEMETRFVTCPEAVVPLDAFVVKATFAVTVAPAAKLVDAGVTVSDWKVLVADASCGTANMTAKNKFRAAVSEEIFNGKITTILTRIAPGEIQFATSDPRG